MAEEKGIRATLERVFAELTEVKVVTAVGTLAITLPEENGRTKPVSTPTRRRSPTPLSPSST